MIDMGEVTLEGAKHHPLRNVLTRAIGTQERLEEVDVFSFEIKSADRFLLCSDGLTDMVSGVTIASILNGAKDLESTVGELMHVAIQNGGKDNVTLVAIDVNASKS
jgi:protein phosphatase